MLAKVYVATSSMSPVSCTEVNTRAAEPPNIRNVEINESCPVLCLRQLLHACRSCAPTSTTQQTCTSMRTCQESCIHTLIEYTSCRSRELRERCACAATGGGAERGTSEGRKCRVRVSSWARVSNGRRAGVIGRCRRRRRRRRRMAPWRRRPSARQPPASRPPAACTQAARAGTPRWQSTERRTRARPCRSACSAA